MSNICVAINCRNAGRHRFPKDKDLRQLWEDALQVHNFKATEQHSLCYDHFKEEDYVMIGSSLLRDQLKKDAVPSIFNRNNKKHMTKNEAKRKCIRYATTGTQYEDFPTDPLDIDSVEIINNPVLVRDVATQKSCGSFSINKFKDNDKAIEFYTGLENYKRFSHVFRTACPQRGVKAKYAQMNILNLEDGFFLTIIKLKQNKAEIELALLFDIDIDNVFIVFETWLNCMYDNWWKQHLPDDNLRYIRILNHASRMDTKELKGVNIKQVPEFLKEKDLLAVIDRRPTKNNRNRVNKDETPITLTGFKILLQPMHQKYLPLWSKIYFASCILCGYKEGRTLKKS